MIIERTARFRRAFKKLPAADRDRIIQALRRFAADPAHPSLRVKRIQGTAELWEARASQELRFTFVRVEGGISLSVPGRANAPLEAGRSTRRWGPI